MKRTLVVAMAMMMVAGCGSDAPKDTRTADEITADVDALVADTEAARAELVADLRVDFASFDECAEALPDHAEACREAFPS